jgi:hypothetical protein
MRRGSAAHARSAAAAASPRHARSTAGSGDGDGVGTGDAAPASSGVAVGVGAGECSVGQGVSDATLRLSCGSSGVRAGVGVGDATSISTRAAEGGDESAVDGVCGSQNSERGGTVGVPRAGDATAGAQLRLSSSCALLSGASGVRGGAWAAHAAAVGAQALPGAASDLVGGGVSHRGGTSGKLFSCCRGGELGVHTCRRGDGDGSGVGDGGGASAARSTHAAAAASVAARVVARDASAARKRASVSADGGVVAGDAALPGVAAARKDAALALPRGRSAVPPRAGLRHGRARAPEEGAGERPRGGRADVGVAPRLLGDASTPRGASGCAPPLLRRAWGCAHAGDEKPRDRDSDDASSWGLLAPARRAPGLADRSGVRPLGVAHMLAVAAASTFSSTFGREARAAILKEAKNAGGAHP